MASLCTGTKMAWQAVGKVDYGRKSSEQDNVKFRRSLYFIKDIKAGDIVTADAIKSVRPGFGLPPKYIDKVIGKVVKHDVKVNTPVTNEIFKKELKTELDS